MNALFHLANKAARDCKGCGAEAAVSAALEAL